MHITHALVAAYLNPFSTNNYINLSNDKFKFIVRSDVPEWATEGHFLQDILDRTSHIKRERFDPAYKDDCGDIHGRLKEVADDMVSQDNLKLDDNGNLELNELFGDVPASLQQPETFYPSLTDNANSKVEDLRDSLSNVVDCAIPTLHTKPHPDLINGE